MTVKLENRQTVIDLARHYWIDEGYNIIEAIIKAKIVLEGEND